MRPTKTSLLVIAMIAGCAREAARPTVAADRQFATAPAHIATIDLVPMDFEVWLGVGYAAEPAQLHGTAVAEITNAALEVLQRRSYAIGALVDWDGDVRGRGNVIDKDALRAAVAAMARYGETTPVGALPRPALPARLGQATGSDATLFISGWSFVGAPKRSTADKLAEKVTLAVVGAAATGVVAMAGPAPDLDPLASPCNPLFDVRCQLAHDHVEAVADTGDAFLRAIRDVETNEIANRDARPLRPRTGPSKLFLAMTLVDNRTGRALWHGHQEVPASITSRAALAKATRTLLASLPAR